MATVDHSNTYTRSGLVNIPHRARLRWLTEVVADLDVNGSSYADVGCSNGFVTAAIARAMSATDPVGFDHLEQHLVTGSERHPEIRFELLDLNMRHNELPTFQVVSCLETLEHVGDIEQALQSITQMTSPGGVLLISVPIENGFWGLIKFAAKTTVARRSRQLREVFGQERALRNQLVYLGRLLTNRRVSYCRTERRGGWSAHFGFDHRDLADRLDVLGLPFTSKKRLSNRLFIVHPG